MADFIDNFLDAMGIVAQDRVDRAQYDGSVRAQIVATDPTNEHQYKIQIGSQKVDATGALGYKTNDIVYVMKPKSSSTATYLIIGAESYGVNDDKLVENKYVFNNRNTINVGEGEIISLPQDAEEVSSSNFFYELYEKDTNSGRALQAWLKAYIPHSQAICIKADFMPYFNNEDFFSSWNWEEWEEEYCNYGLKVTLEFKNGSTKDYILDINDMYGFPYKGVVDSTQSKIIVLTEDERKNFNSIKSIGVFLNNYTVGTEDNAIEVLNFQISALQELDTLKEDSFKIEAEASELEFTNDLSSLAFVGVLLSSKEVDFNIKWQIDNPFEKSGWQTIQEGVYQFNLQSSQVPRKNSKIRAVVTYQEGDTVIELISNVLEIENKRSEDIYSIELIKNDGATEVQAFVTINSKLITSGLQHQWFRNETKDKDYTDSFLTINPYAIEGVATYTCHVQRTVDETATYLGSNTISVYGKAQIDAGVQIIGAKTYMYNGGGEAMESSDQSPLTVKFYDEDGKEIHYYKDESKKDTNWTVEWIIPTNNTMLGGVFKTTDDQCYYKIKKYYNYEARDNQIKAVVTYKGNKYSNAVDIGFLMTGQPGTNGTEYICTISDITSAESDTDVIKKSFDADEWIAYKQDTTIALKCVLRKIGTNEEVTGASYTWSFTNSYRINDNQGWVEKVEINGSTWSEQSFSQSTIVRCEVTYDNKKFYGYTSLVYYSGDTCPVKENSGFARVLYSSKGDNPQYPKNARFLNSQGEAIDVPYTPPSSYAEKYEIENGMPCVKFLTVNGVVIPILYTLNRWENAFINNWDGGALKMGDDYIIGAQAAFGQKLEDNSFTGVLLGKTDKGESGLYGLKEGVVTFSLDANNGDAFFAGHVEAKSGTIGTMTIKEAEDKINSNTRNLIRDSEKTRSKKAGENDTHTAITFYLTTPIKKGVTYSFSLDILGYTFDASHAKKQWTMAFYSPTVGYTDNFLYLKPPSNPPARISGQITAKWDTIDRIYLYLGHIDSSGGQANNNSIKITKVKLEEGKKANDWTPAPEDAIPAKQVGTDNNFGWEVDPVTGWRMYNIIDGKEQNVFRIFKDSDQYAAWMTGTIVADHGNIGDWKIEDGSLKYSTKFGAVTFGTLTEEDLTTTGLFYQSKNTDEGSSSISLANSAYIGLVGKCPDGNEASINILGYMGTIKLMAYLPAPNPSDINSKRPSAGIEIGRPFRSLTREDLGVYLIGNAYLEAPEAVSSDATLKNSITNFDERYSLFYDDLKPCQFKYNNGTSNRYHAGFIAQEVQTALKENNISESEFAGIVSTIERETQRDILSLRYTEFIPLNTWQIQMLKARISELEQKITSLEKVIEIQDYEEISESPIE